MVYDRRHLVARDTASLDPEAALWRSLWASHGMPLALPYQPPNGLVIGNIEFIDENIDHAHWVGVADVVVEAFWK